MFCQNCGAELRLEEGFCAVCGAGIPKPALHQEPETRRNKGQRLKAETEEKKTYNSAQYSHQGSSLLDPTPTSHAAQPDPRQIRSFQAIRQASSQRGSMRSLPPVASLAVPASAPRRDAAQEEVTPPLPTAFARGQDDLVEAEASAPLAAPSAPAATNGHAPTAQGDIRAILNGYHAVNAAAPGGPGANGHADPGSASDSVGDSAEQPDTASVSASGLLLPGDVPGRVALSALLCMLLSFALPWVIIGGERATPLSLGWPVLVPLAVLIAVGLTLALPERTRYTRFVPALPFALGCFSLGSALIIFLISSAIAANSVGIAFLGVDIGYVLFALASLVLASAGYVKLLRELPLLLAGRLRLVPLPGMLGNLTGVQAGRRTTPPATQPAAAPDDAS
ncbi:MAG TPA: zinc ribbon domain-containing protein [Ktedonobacterales bacterium]|jgi:hypothetical protein